MELSDIMSVISNTGFPIACVVVLFWTQEKDRTRQNEMNEKMSTAIQNNTIAMEKIASKLGVQ